MRIPIVLATLALLPAAPAFAQNSGAAEGLYLSDLTTAAWQAYRRNDTVEGDARCVELREALANARYHDFSQVRGSHELVAQHCPRGSSSASSTPTPAQGPTQYDPQKEVPARVTGDARIVWTLLLGSQYSLESDGNLPTTNPVRIANFQRSRTMCIAGRGWTQGAGPGSMALLDTCAAVALIVQNDPKGCAEMREALPGLSEPAALNGTFAELMPRYRKAAEQILANTSICKSR